MALLKPYASFSWSPRRAHSTNVAADVQRPSHGQIDTSLDGIVRAASSRSAAQIRTCLRAIILSLRGSKRAHIDKDFPQEGRMAFQTERGVRQVDGGTPSVLCRRPFHVGVAAEVHEDENHRDV